ncbi:MAG: hypothetical protein JWN73_4176 [Betaproteobacteria bacterium]|nr:hypothetical protein [Betaproteobacteria bacterium]
MKMRWIIGVMACAAAFGAQAQYKYIGPDGKVVYSDQPPPPNAKVLEKKGMSSGSAGSSDLPFALQTAVKNSPVTLYTAPSCGAPCNDGRALLNQRGVPFSEKTISTPEDVTEFTKAVNAKQVPVLMVGKSKLSPFQPEDWNGALTNAGYPATSQLPQGYKNPSPTNFAQAASPPAATTAAPANNTAPPTGQAAAPAGDSSNKPSWFKGF